MSTSQLEVNAWVQTENTFAAVQAWAYLDEPGPPAAAEPAPEPPSPPLAAAEPAPALPDDFWQDWFGIWR